MSNFNVAFFGAKVAPEIGNIKGNVSDITFYELKKSGDSVTMIEPTRYPESVAPLFYAAEMSEFAILVVDEIDATIGESIVMLDTVGIENGWIILRNYLQPEQIKPLLEGTVLENYEFKEYDPIELRESLMEMALELKREPGEGSRGICPVNSHFNVTGVGTVALGYVADGYVRKHAKMKVLPLGKEVTLRSIQKYSLNFDSATVGDHLGMALRGIESDDLDRGFVVTDDEDVTMTTKFTGKVKTVKFWKEPLRDGMVMHLGHWRQMIPFRMSLSGDEVTFDLNSELIYKPGDKAVLMYLEGGKLRVVGSVTL